MKDQKPIKPIKPINPINIEEVDLIDILDVDLGTDIDLYLDQHLNQENNFEASTPFTPSVPFCNPERNLTDLFAGKGVKSTQTFPIPLPIEKEHKIILEAFENASPEMIDTMIAELDQYTQYLVRKAD